MLTARRASGRQRTTPPYPPLCRTFSKTFPASRGSPAPLPPACPRPSPIPAPNKNKGLFSGCEAVKGLDIDNAPTAMVQKQNARLYSRAGLEQVALVLKPNGRALFWSAPPDPAFGKRLSRAGL